MNFGAILRQAIVSGQFRRVVEISRELMDAGRRDRALADLNARGGIRGGEGMRFRNARGEMPQSTVDSLADRGFMFDGFDGYQGFNARGDMVSLDARGTRSIDTPLTRGLVPDDGSPIYAPYEGFRVWPHLPYDTAPGPWMGRGFPPAYHDFAAGQGPESVVYPSASWEIHNFNVPRAFGGMHDGWFG